MKIAILSNNYIPHIGGAEIFAIELAKYLKNKGHEVDIITQKQSGVKDFEIIDDVNVYRVNNIGIRGLGYFSATINMLRTLLKLDGEKSYDIVHSIAESPTSQVGTFFQKLKKKPHIITIQGGHLSKRDLDSGWNNKILKKFIEWSFKNSDYLHAISLALAEESKLLGAKNVVIFPNGVNENMLNYKSKSLIRQQLGISDNEIIIISLARLVPLKGIKYVIMAFSKLVEEDLNTRLIVIGEGHQKKELEKLTKELKIDDKVDFKGFIPHDELPNILPAGDVFVLTPEYEGLGIVFIEALASGVPVIASPVGGIADIIEDRKNGLFVEHGDVAKLFEAMQFLISDEETRDKYRNEGITTVKEKFLWEPILSQIEGLYSKV
ncbi:MAG: glycosyltransferase [Methanobacterium sp. Maddingley MBC34]|nr:MAG: glycosyltransferase [Methanobacterium sp. Maddingley MBC34]